MIINAENLILGRLASYVAKNALLGEDVDIINCEKVVITGRKDASIKKYLHIKSRGTHKGPFLPKMPNLFVRRTIRGMLPYKKGRGRDAFQKIKCYIGVPSQLKDKKFETIKSADVSKIPTLYYTTVGEIQVSKSSLSINNFKIDWIIKAIETIAAHLNERT